MSKRKTSKRFYKKRLYLKNFIANYVFDDSYYRGLEETVERVKKYRGEINKLYLCLKKEEEKWGCENPEKNPLMYDLDDLESIDSNLSYISDRFSAACRLYWLLHTPEAVEKLKK